MLNLSNAPQNNTLTVKGEKYFYKKISGRVYLLPAKCRHRGGPLHLATLCKESASLICPWHQRKETLEKLMQKAIPIVVFRSKITRVLIDEFLEVKTTFCQL